MRTIKFLHNLKKKFARWLFEDEFNTLKENAERAESRFELAMISHQKSTEAINTAISACETLEKVCAPLLDVGTDIGFRDDHSWAVICVKGKPEYVKFMPLEHRDTQEIINFLRRFEGSNRIIDSPLAWRGMIDRELFLR